MNKRPLISVVIPVYNVEYYLRRCLNSVLAQTYSNLEIILVDDGSADSSGKICDEYAEKDSRINVIHKENGGLSDARNVGIKTTSSDYVAFIDSDDYVEKQYVQRLVWILLKNNADIAICGYYHGNQDRFPKSKRYHRKVQCFSSKKMLKNWHGKYKNFETTAWNKLYKRSLFVENGIYYPVGYFNEDALTTHLLVDKAQKIALTNEKLYYYYQRKESIMNTMSEKKIRDCIYAQNERLKFFKENGYQEAYERLQVKLLKYYILCYLTIDKELYVEVGEELIKQYRKSLKAANTFHEFKIWEKVFLLFLEKHYTHIRKIMQIGI